MKFFKTASLLFAAISLAFCLCIPANAAPEVRGMVGVGTWKTQAEFKEIEVTKNGKTLFQSDFSQGLGDWKTPRGKWEVEGGVLRQTSSDENTAAYVGDPHWSDYVLSLKARKIGGNEGFLIYFRAPDENGTTRWNLGGWNNAKHAFEFSGAAEQQIAGTIETGRWYNVKIEVQGDSIKGYLDGVLVQQTTRNAPAPSPAQRWGDWTKWGDQGDGTYANPVLPADYSDLDCIRDGSDFYAISSTMQFSPGMAILHSKDLVNWTVVGHAVPDVTQIGPEMNWDRMNRYGRGVWAGSIRFHDGKFWIYFGTADEGYFMTTATTPAGPWAPLTSFMKESGWDDCCPFWDDDGQGYFIGTKFKDNYKTYVFKMTPDGQAPIMESAVLVNEGNYREANKLFKKDGWYYHFYSEVKGARVVMMQRAKNVLGPYDEKKQLTDQNREAKEPNQGGLVDTPNGDWYFFTHHGTGDWEGRAASLLPVKWVDGWPLIGEMAQNGLGQMVWTGKNPLPKTKIEVPQSSDEFQNALLGPQWEWNHQPRAEKWSLTEKSGVLRLKSWKPLGNDDLLRAGNTLTQRTFRSTNNEVVAKFDLSGLADGQKAGLCHFVQGNHAVLGVAQEGATRTLEYRQNGKITLGPVLTQNDLWVRSTWGLDGRSQFSYSLDGKIFTDFGEPYQLCWGGYRGDRIGIYCYNNKADAGFVDVDFFHYAFDGRNAKPRSQLPISKQKMDNSSSWLQMRGIRKSFSGVEVLHGVDFSVNGGEVVALMGENGAGKSTLMKILGGDYVRDGGEILLDGSPVAFNSPKDAENAGVRIIYQELNYAPELSVAENVLLGHLPRKNGFSIDWNAAFARTAEILALLKAEIDPRELVGRLSVGKQQLVEIAKALSHRQTRVLVMDEPTAALTSREVALLFETIESLRSRGVAIIYISHRLDEVEQIAGRVVVLRDGVTAGDVSMKETSRGEIVRMMVGREVETLFPTRGGQTGETVLEVLGLSRSHHFQDVNFGVRAGEIVGLYGLLGAGQMEVVRALFGSPPAVSGEIKVAGKLVKVASPREAKREGIGFVSEDRKREGLVLGLSVSENLTLGNWNSIARNGVFAPTRERERAAHWTGVLGIRARNSAQAVGTLSGGNQQKVVLARWLEAGTRVLLLAEPTRGVDVGARADIYAVLETLREQGLALVLVSTDMEEILALSDRILVFARGRIVNEFSRETATQETLLVAAAGEKSL